MSDTACTEQNPLCTHRAALPAMCAAVLGSMPLYNQLLTRCMAGPVLLAVTLQHWFRVNT